MIENNRKCSQCGKNDDILPYYDTNCKSPICKKCLDKNLSSNSKYSQEKNISNNTNLDNVKIILKKEDKKLDSKESNKKEVDIIFLNKKKRRISKKIIFIRKKKDEFKNIILKIINDTTSKNKFQKGIKKSLSSSSPSPSLSSTEKKCDLCNKSKFNKENKIIKFLSKNNFIKFFEILYNDLEQDKYKENLIKISPTKYYQIMEQKKNVTQIKINKGPSISTSPASPSPSTSSKNLKNFCYLCIYNYLLKKKWNYFIIRKIQI